MAKKDTISAVIVDLDGTLIDTEKYYRRCWPAAFAHFGYTLTDEQALSLRSLGRPFAQEYLRELSGDANFDYERVRSYRKEIMEQMIMEQGLELKSGAVELLCYLREKGIRTAVATATDIERATRYLKKSGLYEYFDHVISASMVEEGKPSPDIYLLACKELMLAPKMCFAVEDSPNGAMSAYRAGCKVVYVPDQTPADEEIKRMAFSVQEQLNGIMTLL